LKIIITIKILKFTNQHFNQSLISFKCLDFNYFIINQLIIIIITTTTTTTTIPINQLIIIITTITINLLNY
jgi:hypothetical protein